MTPVAATISTLMGVQSILMTLAEQQFPHFAPVEATRLTSSPIFLGCALGLILALGFATLIVLSFGGLS